MVASATTGRQEFLQIFDKTVTIRCVQGSKLICSTGSGFLALYVYACEVSVHNCLRGLTCAGASWF